MDDMQRMLIERACERLVTEYCHFVDHGEAAKIAGQFTEDGVWANRASTFSGREAIAGSFQRRQDNAARISRHATGVVYLTLYRHDGEAGRRTSPSDIPDVVGEYRDTFVRTADGWRFKRREVHVSFSKMKA
jgi:hypothetical protein